MVELKCPVCKSTLLSEEVQLRADDEGSALVKWCPIHGIHYNLYASYVTFCKLCPWTTESDPSRLVNQVDVTEPLTIGCNVAHGMPDVKVVHDVLWIECIIQLSNVDDTALKSMKRSDCIYCWSVDTVYRDWALDVSKVYVDHPVMSTLCHDNVVRVREQETGSVIGCNYSIYTVHKGMTPSREARMFYLDMTVYEFEQQYSDCLCIVTRDEKGASFRYVAMIEPVNGTDLNANEHLVPAYLKCAELLGLSARIPACKHWNKWSVPFLGMLSCTELVSIDLSKINIPEHALVRCIEAKGTYCFVLVTSYAVFILDRGITHARIANVKVNYLHSTEDKCNLIYSGYLTEQTFAPIDSWMVGEHLIKGNHKIRLSEVIVDNGSASLEVKNLEFHDQVSRDWRLLYIGNQSSLRVIRRQRKLGPRSIDTSCILNLIHRILVSRLVKMADSGFEFVLVIKSYPFKFYSNICSHWKCVFLYEEDWESDSNLVPRISLAREAEDALCLDGTRQEYYTYSEYEPVMAISQGYDLEECIRSCVKGSPVHCCSNDLVSSAMGYAWSNIILLDFHDQDPMRVPDDVNYLSVLGSKQTQQCLKKCWGAVEEVVCIDTRNWDLTEFCKYTGQSLENVNVVCTKTLSPYFSTEYIGIDASST